MAYTRGILNRLPGREAIHNRLTELLSIGSVTPPVMAGRHYFYTRREGLQNQPVLYVRDGLDGADRVLVDANKLSADGTIALDWFQPSETGKYIAYGTSPSGSEMSTLHILETKTGTVLADTTIPASITHAPLSLAKFQRARKCTIGTSTITNSRTIPKIFPKTAISQFLARDAILKTGRIFLSPMTGAGC
jgi:protease II